MFSQYSVSNQRTLVCDRSSGEYALRINASGPCEICAAVDPDLPTCADVGKPHKADSLLERTWPAISLSLWDAAETATRVLLEHESRIWYWISSGRAEKRRNEDICIEYFCL